MVSPNPQHPSGCPRLIMENHAISITVTREWIGTIDDDLLAEALAETEDDFDKAVNVLVNELTPEELGSFFDDNEFIDWRVI